MAALELVKGNCAQDSIELGDNSTVFGRHPSCRVVLDGTKISRHHATVSLSNGGYFIEDLKSANGTFINGKRIDSKQQLFDRDEIRFGSHVFRFRVSSDNGVSASAAKSPHEAYDNWFMNTDVPTPSWVEGAVSAEPIAADRDDSSIVSTMDAQSSTLTDARAEIKLQAMRQIGSVLGQVVSLRKVLQRILDALFTIFARAEEGFILLRDSADGGLTVKATKVRDPEKTKPIAFSTTIVNQALTNGQAILSIDASIDLRFQDSASLDDLGLRSVMCVPLIGKESSQLGVIQLSARDPAFQFSEDDLDLILSVASQCSLAVDNANLHERTLWRTQMERELMAAQQVQQDFLPDQPPQLANYEFSDYYKAAHRIGGDYFDYIDLPSGKLAVALADVAGKGVPAALLMAKLYSMVRHALLTHSSLAEATNSLNAVISTKGMAERFITCILAVIDAENHKLSIANAGHLPPIRRNAGGRVEMIGLEESGFPLGLVPDHEYHILDLDLEEGESWLFFTDGVTEAMNPNQELYSVERLMNTITVGPATIGPLVNGIVSDVRKFADNRPQNDDICLLGFHRIVETA